MLPLHSLNAAASDAASGGDFATAAGLLRRVLELQVAALGPDHPDLTPTLNTLALMLERSGDTAEAGRCYRRALALAILAHGPDAASVRVSQANLAAFYREYGAEDNDDPNVSPGGLDDFAPGSAAPGPPVPPVPPAPAMTVRSAPLPAAPPLPAVPLPSVAPPPARPVTRPWRNPEALLAVPKETEVRLPIFAARRPPAPLPAPAMRPLFVPQEAPASSWRRTAGGIMILALGIALAGVPAWWLRGAGASPVTPSPAVVAPGIGTSGNAPAAGTIAAGEAAAISPLDRAASAKTPDVPPPVDGPPAAEIEPDDVTSDSEPRDGLTAADDKLAVAPGDATASPTAAVAPSSASLRLAEAGLCAELSIGQGQWHCEPTRDQPRGGSVYYYTRVASPRDELIRHRWTRDGRLVQTVVLRILTNPGDGYRTFSRQSGPLLEAGTWQVALLAPDGRVLDQTEFVVR